MHHESPLTRLNFKEECSISRAASTARRSGKEAGIRHSSLHRSQPETGLKMQNISFLSIKDAIPKIQIN
jgi:hypothetical protein